MGYGTRGGPLGHKIRTYWPDDDENKMYIDASNYKTTMLEIIEKINEKWPGTSLGNIQISAMEIQTDCLGYDAYDPMDYTDFIIIEKIAGA